MFLRNLFLGILLFSSVFSIQASKNNAIVPYAVQLNTGTVPSRHEPARIYSKTYTSASYYANNLYESPQESIDHFENEQLDISVALKSLSKLVVLHDHDGFSVVEEGLLKKVYSYDVDPLLKKMTVEQLLTFQKEGGLLKVSKLSNGDYKLRAHVKGLGGGIWGAWIGAVAGKFIVHFAAQSAIAIVAIPVTIASGGVLTGPFILAAETALLPSIEVASNVAAVGLGIAGAVATGPI